ncbi:MAG: hypothetical protein DWQ47_15220 [Acidobacteria bacterium]|nr:MAG: hypothetical protein DWQ32_02620 [Acidobacteriota bacterium]REK02587.1 MAG: hypothetical protein DWQ38_09515 [Acidobacteriota bacterium]REK13610.1 MAG: hypothetical protein DWQ43_08310 [Acidobacteriota bacterium]REK41604.1 MAG: hypothetical protein DWQ47_15220 [Acidobacteriota bacterium]
MKNSFSSKVFGTFGFAAVAILSYFLISCSSTPTGLRSLAPANTAIYLETPDLGVLLGRLADNPSITGGEPAFDPSLLEGVEAAVAVSGFEATESPVTDSEAVLNFKPDFVLIADTKAWSWQMESLVEATLGRFVNGHYGVGTRAEKIIRDGNRWYVWTSPDGRKAYAAISGSTVFFGNREESVLECLSVKEGKIDSLLSNDRLSRQYESAKGKLAFGYVSEDGIAQLSDFAGVSMAIDQSEEAGAQTVISSVFPQLIRNSIREIVWTATAHEDGIEDVIDLRLESDVSEAFVASMSPSAAADNEITKFIPAEAYSATRYNLRNPRVAFRSLILASALKVDQAATRFIPALGASLLQPYGVEDPEAFLSYCDPFLLTIQFDEAGDSAAAVVKTDNFEEIREHLIEGFAPVESEEKETLEDPRTGLRAAREGSYLVLGDPVSVAKTLRAFAGRSEAAKGNDITRTQAFAFLGRPEHTSVTVSRDGSTAADLAKVFVDGPANVRTETFDLTLTDFEQFGIRRTYRSEFGFPGYLIGMFGD